MIVAFYRGKTRLFNRFVSWWTRGPYSHTEAVFTGRDVIDAATLPPMALCGSSSFMDDGVRMKMIQLNPEHWDILSVPTVDSRIVLDWFQEHLGDGYDAIGLLSTSTPIKNSSSRYFCNEAVGAAAGIDEPWRFNPNSFARLLERMPGSRWLQGGPLNNGRAPR